MYILVHTHYSSTSIILLHIPSFSQQKSTFLTHILSNQYLHISPLCLQSKVHTTHTHSDTTFAVFFGGCFSSPAVKVVPVASSVYLLDVRLKLRIRNLNHACQLFALPHAFAMELIDSPNPSIPFFSLFAFYCVLACLSLSLSHSYFPFKLKGTWSYIPSN